MTSPKFPQPAAVVGIPNRVAASMTTNFDTNSTTLVDIGFSITFTPAGTKALIQAIGACSPSNTTANAVFSVNCDGGIGDLPLAACCGNAGGRQPISGAAVFTGLTPGQRYTFKVQVKISAGDVYLRPASITDSEMLTLIASDIA